MTDTVVRVQRWNERRFFVECRYCDKTHGHGFGVPPDQIDYRGIHRQADCKYGTTYSVAFPFDEAGGKAAYEIDKADAQFVSAFALDREPSKVTIDTAGRVAAPEPVRGARVDLNTASKRVREAVAKCVTGEDKALRKQLRRFRHKEDQKDLNMFLHGEDAGNGNTVLHLAAMEETAEVVKLLLRYGCEVNARNRRGRTPLMCAALWGRPRNVELLLDRQADKTLRDEDGKLAVDFAKNSVDNEAERDSALVDKEAWSYVARSGHWKQVEVLLGDQATHEGVFGFGAPNNQRPRYAVQPDASFAIVTTVATEMESGWTQVALLDRGERFPIVLASSRMVNGMAVDTAVGGQSLAQLVARVAGLIGFELPAEGFDAAGHAEMQLMAYFVDKHVFLSDETMDEQEIRRLLLQQVDNEFAELDQDDPRAPLSLLKNAQPRVRVTQAAILSSTAVCRHCVQFCNRVNASFDLALALEYRGEGDLSSAFVNLSVEFLAGRCGVMHEAEALCRSLLSRIEGLLGNQVIVVQLSQYTSAAPEEVSSIESVAARFYLLLERFGGKPVVWRLVSTRNLVEALRGLHTDLDRVDGVVSHFDETQWGAAVADARLQVARNADRLARSDVATPEAQEEAIALLVHERARFKAYYTTDERSLLKRLLSDAAELTQASVPESEDWFIPRSEVAFNVNRVLGEGSFATAHRGVWRKKEIVVKRYKTQSETDKRTFLREARLWWKARHPNVVQMLGACHVGEDLPFIVCEYVGGGTLKSYMFEQREAGRLVAWRTMLQVAKAVHYLHERQEAIIHSDLKSDNVLMTEHGDVKLSDFGLSFEEAGSRAQPERGWGALAWRAPEVALAQSHEDVRSKAADVYSLGKCVVWAVTGTLPWGDLEGYAIKPHLEMQTAMPRPDGMQDGQWTLVERMCAYDPKARMPLANAIDQIEAFANEEKIADRSKPTKPVDKADSADHWVASTTSIATDERFNWS